MKIEDCKTLPEFFGVENGGSIWVEGHRFRVSIYNLLCENLPGKQDSKALVGCLTGQLKWSKHEPMTAEEENILRELAAWHPDWEKLKIYNDTEIAVFSFSSRGTFFSLPFPSYGKNKSKANEILIPILQKHGKIYLDDYR